MQALDESGSRLLASLTHGCFSDDLRKSAADLVSLSRGYDQSTVFGRLTSTG